MRRRRYRWLNGSYPVTIEGEIDPPESDFVDCFRTRLDRGAYSTDDINVARFAVRKAIGGQLVKLARRR